VSDPDRAVELGEQYRERFSVQEYRSGPRIDGVELRELRRFEEDGGSFNEVMRVSDGEAEDWPGFAPRQCSHSEVLPGAIKAFHVHRRQTDLWFVPAGSRLLVGLVDVREESATAGAQMRFVAGAGRSHMLLIPPGVAHGCANLGGAASALLYFTDRQFDASDPDEGRLPWDLLGAGFWRIQPG
jgi:dTDP-4-dehydrorhamnose 3,5-epimerase